MSPSTRLYGPIHCRAYLRRSQSLLLRPRRTSSQKQRLPRACSMAGTIVTTTRGVKASQSCHSNLRGRTSRRHPLPLRQPCQGKTSSMRAHQRPHWAGGQAPARHATNRYVSRCSRPRRLRWMRRTMMPTRRGSAGGGLGESLGIDGQIRVWVERGRNPISLSTRVTRTTRTTRLRRTGNGWLECERASNGSDGSCIGALRFVLVQVRDDTM